MRHVMYECGLMEPPTIEELAWSHRPPFASEALLCPLGLSPSEIRLWKDMCLTAVKKISKMEVGVRDRVDWKGHIVQLSHDSSIAYCGLCHIARKASDAKYVATKPCACADGMTMWEGEYCMMQSHMLQLQTMRWKKAGVRLILRCGRCGYWTWALNARIRSKCRLAASSSSGG